MIQYSQVSAAKCQLPFRRVRFFFSGRYQECSGCSMKENLALHCMGLHSLSMNSMIFIQWADKLSWADYHQWESVSLWGIRSIDNILYHPKYELTKIRNNYRPLLLAINMLVEDQCTNQTRAFHILTVNSQSGCINQMADQLTSWPNLENNWRAVSIIADKRCLRRVRSNGI